jgi:hypothetical protein
LYRNGRPFALLILEPPIHPCYNLCSDVHPYACILLEKAGLFLLGVRTRALSYRRLC